MAKNWTVSEVANAIINNEMESMLDFGKRFPIATNALTSALKGADTLATALFFSFPEYLTMGKVEKVLKTQIEEGTFGTPATTSASEEDTDGGDDAGEDAAPAEKTAKPADKATKPADKAPAASGDLNSKTSSELYYLAKEYGFKGADLKGSKSDLIARIESAMKSGTKPAGGDKAEAAKPADKKDGTAKTKYEGKTAKELYGECKERKLTVEQKKPAQYYIDALEADDAEKNSKVDYSGKTAKELYGICKEKGLEPEQKKPAQYYIDLLTAADADGEDEGWADEGEAAGKKDEDWEI